MKLYHGSNVEVQKPDLSKSKPYKDFGQGFYLSSNYEQAAALAVQKVAMLKVGAPIVSVFEFNEQLLQSDVMSVKLFDDYCEEWAKFVLQNRNKAAIHPVHSYDVVVGPIADDSVTYQLRRFMSGIISMEVLIEELKYAKGITIQYYFGTSLALSYLQKL